MPESVEPREDEFADGPEEELEDDFDGDLEEDLEEDFEDDSDDDLEEELGDESMSGDQAGMSEAWDEAEEADDPMADLLYEIVTRMGFKDIEIEWEEREDHVRYFVEGADLGALIGRHGSTLEALQYLAGVINSRRGLVEHKIIVDIEGYRERRESRLRRLAQRTANEALREGQEIALEPMSAGDRRVIHLALSTNNSVTTFSEGEEPDRCVIVAPRRDRR
ncbi:MAG: RNA-binding cell elongation regulator Jag/EloR [Candidatus Xenobium sp.]|jgi:predicted RNA-binding protein Jag|nr:KH domain-containing protein [Burkholderiales bacterium]